MQANQELLNFGIQIDNDGDPYEKTVPVKSFIPDTHELLFQFLKTDMSQIISHAEYAFRIGRSIPEDLINEISGIHPYFKEKTFILICLVKTAFQFLKDSSDFSDNDEIEEARVRQIFGNLIGSNWDVLGIKESEDIESLYEMHDWQKEFDYKVMMLLDDTNEALASYSLPIRIALYETGSSKWDESYIPGGHGMDFKVSKTYVLDYSSGAASVRAALDFDDDPANRLVADLRSLSEKDSKMSDRVRVLADSFKPSKGPGYHVEYNIDRFSDLINLEIWMMLSNGVRIKRCNSCGRYFVVSKEIPYDYCPYLDEKGSSCLSRYLMKACAVDIKKSYIRVYHSLYGKMKRGNISQEQINKWFELVKKIKTEFLEGKIPLSEYEKKLKDAAVLVKNA